MLLLTISLNWFLYLLAAIIIVWFILYLVNTYLPMDAKLKKFITVIVVVLAIIYFIYLFIQLPHYTL